MSGNSVLVSKILVLDDGIAHFDSLKLLCEEYGLVGIKPQQGGAEAVMAILKSNVDLGGILLYENYGGSAGKGLELAKEIHGSRPELPIFLRRDRLASVAGLGEKEAAMFRCAYVLDDLQMLRATLDASIFNRIYPNDLVRGISELTRASLEYLFRNCDIDVETPYLVKDRIIYGEVFSMIAIESNWCRGYMMLQASEDAVLSLIPQEAGNESDAKNFRELNNVLGEATNMIWGSFKNRYVGPNEEMRSVMQTQVPIIINHHRRYISFGSEDPQLCFKYTLRERSGNKAPVPIYQRFVFNLSWSPEEFKENATVESLVEAGELDLF
ncbi:MAG: chemotaxis protein CheX [Burkholderiales bacterium]